jgi:hypothetical protein
MRGNVLLICPTAQARLVRQVGATGKWRMVLMRELPVGQLLSAIPWPRISDDLA